MVEPSVKIALKGRAHTLGTEGEEENTAAASFLGQVSKKEGHYSLST